MTHTGSMQWIAKDESGRLVVARNADAGQDYFCLECGGVVHCRAGMLRRVHFFHLQRPASCRQAGKSAAHLQTQLVLEQSIGPELIQLERSFPSIGRIADVCWEAEGLIFEVQCSPISMEEVRQRNADYATEGYQVVWILHERSFNQKQVRAAEHYLQGHPHYFTNIDDEGQGQIYDQYSLRKGARRVSYLPRLVIDPSCPKRHEAYPLYFKGDRTDLTLSAPNDERVQRMQQLSEEIVYQASFSWRKPLLAVKDAYCALLNSLLEVFCR